MFSSLNHDEKIALVGLMKWLTLSDLDTTPDEVTLIQKVVDELGESKYHELFNEVDRRFGSREEFLEFLAQIGTPPVRRLIFDFMLEYAQADTSDIKECRDLVLLSRIWDLES